MNSTKSEKIPTVDQKPHAAFFRQSGWLMIATVGGGMLMWGVHFLNKVIPPGEYAAFGALLMVVACMPTMPLQMIFAQQTAHALATGRERQLAGTIRWAWLLVTVVWLLAAAAVYIFQRQIVAGWQLPNAVGLWMMMSAILLSFWMPMFGGVLQGKQDFFWLGWAAILGGVSRLAVAALLVLALGMGAAGMLMGASIGIAAAAGIAIWQSRDLWMLPGEKEDHSALWRQVLPLLLGFGACQIMFTADTIVAKAYFPDAAMKPYVVAGTLSRALLWIVLPLAAVMFPKIVHASAKAEKTNLFSIVVLGTAVLAIGGGLGLWITGPLVVRIVATSADVAGTMALIPWYAGAMVPLALANVMVNDLLARGRFKVVPWMALLAAGYLSALPWLLNRFPGKPEVVLQTLGAFNLLLFLVSAWFTWGVKAGAKVEDRA